MRCYALQWVITFKNIENLPNFQKFRALLDSSSFGGSVAPALAFPVVKRIFITEWAWPIHLSSMIKSSSFWALLWISVPQFNALQSETFVLNNSEKKEMFRRKLCFMLELNLKWSSEIAFICMLSRMHIYGTV